MSCLLEDLPPRSFVDFTVPNRADGSPLTKCVQPGDCEAYVSWLAEYLYDSELPLSPNQRAWLSASKDTPERLIFGCSDVAGYAVWDLDAMVREFERGRTYEQMESELRQRSDEFQTAAQRPDGQNEPLSLDALARLYQEWQEEQAAGAQWTHADIPYRPLLSWALRQTHDAEKRRRYMQMFFQNFGDNASK
jgi:hypothetical protein